jgi:acetylornithine deacetylase/succinyl-diaminopimelate desuccinylase-like protein
MDPLQSYVAENRERWLTELCEFLRIPSVSTLPDHAGEVRRGAEFLRDALKRIGAERAEVIPSAGHPLVYAERMSAPGKPTVLFYGHYDVQPPDPLNEWVSAPFEPTVRNGNLYARGSADDKGQVMLQLKAVEALEKTAGKLPVNVKFIFEGEEETGGAAIAKFVPENKELLKADSVIVCDTELFEPGLPTLCIGLRGMVYTEIEVEGASHDLHSGLYGGVAPNPLQTLAWILAELKGRDGKINLPGLYDRVIPPNATERASWQRLPFDAQKMLRDEIGSPALEGESQLGELERMWARPTLEVHGIVGGYVAPGAKTVIPAKATAKVSLRLVPDQRPDEVFAALEKRVAELAPRSVRVKVRLIHSADPLLLDTGHPAMATASRVFSEVWTKETVFVRSGGSIPVVALFHEHLGIPSVMMGFGLPDDNLHAPNEKFNLSNFYRGAETIARFLAALG